MCQQRVESKRRNSIPNPRVLPPRTRRNQPIHQEFSKIFTKINKIKKIIRTGPQPPPTTSATIMPEITYAPWDATQQPRQLESIRRLISTDLSEPYSIYVYCYFLYQWGELCYMVSLSHSPPCTPCSSYRGRREWTNEP